VIEPFPTVGRAFAHERLVGPGETGVDGRARLDAIADWLQAVAHADVVDAGLADLVLWVVRRVELRVERFPRLGERVEVRTACSALGARWAERRTALSGVEAVALWVAIDPTTLRPARIDALAGVYGESAGDRRVKTGLLHPPPPDGMSGRPWTFRRADLDVAAHVNNAVYWRVLAEEPLDAPLTVECEHRVPCAAEDVTVVADGPRRWVVRADGSVSASFSVG
jgi:acyl-ACP thioesterase